jgi:hypothetical protein
VTRYLLDTNIISNLAKPERLLAWMSAQRDDDMFIASLTVAEIRRGILEKPRGRKRDELERWFSGPEWPQLERAPLRRRGGGASEPRHGVALLRGMGLTPRIPLALAFTHARSSRRPIAQSKSVMIRSSPPNSADATNECK